ncbi:PadR family transcriptional regulator [Gryllotalpicola protaetiae]|uniref:PadR family transcriptional regulator n=2 Tax=Gryllotalpicola protaetiae TaxID=2419771 RepID=A0A387C1K9_9MICO|nr:PadR family transcriptional regulator [Gryllotalpicola protaetiae]
MSHQNNTGHHDFPARTARFHHDEHHGPFGGGPFGGRGMRGGFGGFGGGFGPSFDPADFARGGRGRRRASRGDIRAALLSLLAEAPASGYALIKAIGDKTDGLWVPSPGSVYPTLQQLVDEELIAPSGEGRKTEYTLTDAGRAYVDEHADELAAAWQAAPSRSGADAELFTSIGKLMGAIHQLRFVASDEQRSQAAAKIDALRKDLYALLAES